MKTLFAPSSTASFTLAPNPTKEEVTITYTEVDKESTIVIYDLLGRSMGEFPLTNTSAITLNTNTYPTGIYIVVLRSPNGIFYQQKLIKE
jgi:hypothetical protein